MDEAGDKSGKSRSGHLIVLVLTSETARLSMTYASVFSHICHLHNPVADSGDALQKLSSHYARIDSYNCYVFSIFFVMLNSFESFKRPARPIAFAFSGSCSIF